jgi:predicted hydrolase (HD superfamily)
MINQLLTQNYQRQPCRTREELTDFDDMDFTETDLNSSEDYEKRFRRTPLLLFKRKFRSRRECILPQKKLMAEAMQPIGRTVFGDPANAENVLSEQEALNLLNEWVENERLRLHMKQVAAVMKAWALEKENLSEVEAHKWWLAGLLHDADWEKYPNDHCRIIIEELERRKIDPSIIHCIASHGPRHFGVEPETIMDKMIYAFDELSGFVHASALIRPARYEGMDVKSVMKKLKTPSFAAQVSREDINDAISRINTSLEDLISFVINHQKEVI